MCPADDSEEILTPTILLWVIMCTLEGMRLMKDKDVDKIMKRNSYYISAIQDIIGGS